MNGRGRLRSSFRIPRAAQRRSSVPGPIGGFTQIDRMGLTGPWMETVRVGLTVAAVLSPKVP